MAPPAKELPRYYVRSQCGVDFQKPELPHHSRTSRFSGCISPPHFALLYLLRGETRSHNPPARGQGSHTPFLF